MMVFAPKTDGADINTSLKIISYFTFLCYIVFIVANLNRFFSVIFVHFLIFLTQKGQILT